MSQIADIAAKQFFGRVDARLAEIAKTTTFRVPGDAVAALGQTLAADALGPSADARKSLVERIGKSAGAQGFAQTLGAKIKANPGFGASIADSRALSGARARAMSGALEDVTKQTQLMVGPNPMHVLMRDLLAVTENQAAEIGRLRDEAAAAAADERKRAEAADRRQRWMFRLTVASFLVTVVSVAVAVLAIVLTA
jgi:hypothetical protein